jgi:SAM-dependent methyltransferase
MGRGEHQRRLVYRLLGFVTAGGDEIADFYERHPYPPPVESLDDYAETWDDPARRRLDHHVLWPTLSYRDDLTILVAGCGTSQAAKYAVRYPRATVVGIDVSQSSLDATHRLVERYELTKVELHRLAIEDVGELDRSFDHIVCTGVIHHLVDPAAGLAALRAVLEPAGMMQLMVYATFGRTGVYLMQEYCRRLGVQPTDASIDELIATLREMPTGHPMNHILRNTPDFQKNDALADALLNPRDVSYTVPELFELIDSAGLRFTRWLRQAPYRPQCGAISETPHGVQISAMPDAEQFAALELFRGTMTRHTVIVGRADSPLPDPPLGWGDDSWRTHVPLRAANVVLVDENLPPGVAGVLINQSHTDRDLVLFVSENERDVFEAIDGHQSFDEINGLSRDFAERLWRHDLIVVDASDSETQE